MNKINIEGEAVIVVKSTPSQSQPQQKTETKISNGKIFLAAIATVLIGFSFVHTSSSVNDPVVDKPVVEEPVVEELEEAPLINEGSFNPAMRP